MINDDLQYLTDNVDEDDIFHGRIIGLLRLALERIEKLEQTQTYFTFNDGNGNIIGASQIKIDKAVSGD